MKWFIVIILLLTNVLYFAWELLRETGMTVQGVQALNIPAAARRLRLVNELPVLPNLSGPNTALVSVEGLIDELPDVKIASLEESIRKVSCFSFGPIPEELQANGLSDWFTSRNAITNIRYREEQARQLFWIYLAPQQSRQAALAILDEFKEKGISHYRLIGHGNLSNAISLGIFSSQEAMNNRLSELRKKGYKPVVAPYDNVRRIYWVDVQLRVAQELLEAVFEGHPARYNSVPVDCSEMALTRS